MPVSSSQPGEYPNQSMGIEYVQDANVGAVNQMGVPLQLGTWSLQAGSGVPAVGGNVGDLYVRTNPAGDSTYLYRCTVAGAAGAATWVAITGA